MALKWHHVNIYNKVSSFDSCSTWFLAHLIVITPLYIGNKKKLDEICEKDINRNELMIEFVWQKS
jgi:hypothetical protein